MGSPQRDLSWITEWYFYDFEDKSVINSGWCYIWAWMAKLNHRDAQLYVYDDYNGLAHAFVKIGCLYYDSSYPRGIHSAKSLEFFVDHEITDARKWLTRHDMASFKEAWSYIPASRTWGTQKLEPWPAELPPKPDLTCTEAAV